MGGIYTQRHFMRTRVILGMAAASWRRSCRHAVSQRKR